MPEPKIKELLNADGPLDGSSLKLILNSTISTIEDNKSQIFNIYETARTEVDACRRQLEELKQQARQTIDRVDALAKQEQVEKQKLVRVSSNFANYSEDRIRASYELVKNVQVALGVERDKEKRIRDQRDKMELRLRHLQVMVQQAEHLALAIGSVLNYLSSQIQGVVWQIETVQKDKFVGARVIKAQEDERYRVSREIHDGPAQDLANLIFQTSICEKLVDYDPAEAKRSLQALRGQIRDCLTSVRQVIFDMRPMALDDLGLGPAVHQLTHKMAERGIVHAEYTVDGKEIPLAKHVEVAAFRIVQEALNNVAHHSGEKKARVRLLYTRTALSILIEDEGKGFDVDELENAGKVVDELSEEDEQEGHFGMIGMKERAKIIGAEFAVTSVPGKGTKVHLRIPLKEEDWARAEKLQAKAAEKK
ncbi:MAG: sensor histidine kinase [Selenomonadaceae bacterium]|nr:sensor histidine kinase [Selenomonadaceae bacterium]